MTSDELEKFYERRLENILKLHIKLIKEEKELTPEAKQRQIEKVKIRKKVKK